jgi:hypothetical protein
MRRVGASIVGIILGLIATTGLYEFLVQNGNIDPNNKVGIVGAARKKHRLHRQRPQPRRRHPRPRPSNF